MPNLFKRLDQWGIRVYNGEAFIMMIEWNNYKEVADHTIYLFHSEEAITKLKHMIAELAIPMDTDAWYPIVTKRALLILLDILDMAQRDGEKVLEFYIESVLRECLIIEDRWESLGVGNSNKDINAVLECLQ